MMVRFVLNPVMTNKENYQYWTVYWCNSSPLYPRDTSQDDQQEGSTRETSWLERCEYTLRWKGVRMIAQVAAFLKISFMGIYKSWTCSLKYRKCENKERNLLLLSISHDSGIKIWQLKFSFFTIQTHLFTYIQKEGINFQDWKILYLISI